MNCPNCGAAMDLVESRRYMQCRHCGTYHFPTTVEADSIRIIGPQANAPACPVCSSPLAHALLDDHPVDFCATCRGMLLPRATFAHVTQTRRAWATTPPVEAVPLNRLEVHRQLRCPRCDGAFETYPHYGPGNVVIDNCTRCDVIWLDFGEMRQIVDAPGRDRGRQHVPRLDEDQRRPAGRSDDDDDWVRLRRKDPARVLFEMLFDDTDY